jgi:hypothetical protein
MRFYRPDECAAWSADLGRPRPDTQAGLMSCEARCPREAHKFYGMASWMAATLGYRRAVLLWVTEWGIWPTSENWHLYYRLRQSYGDYRLLHEAPGHLCLAYEAEDLASFLQLAMINGWGGYLLTEAGYASVVFSHDEYVHFYSDSQPVIDDIRTALRDLGLGPAEESEA